MVRGFQPYLDLLAIAEVGEVQLDPRPAFVLAGDGARVLWANAAGFAFLDAPDMPALLAWRFSDLNPIKAQAARLAKLLPSAQARLEILRFGQGATAATLTAACRRLNLPHDARAVLAVAANAGPTESLTGRAEKLVDLLGGDDRLAAVLTAEGKVLAASGEHEGLSPAEPDIDRLIEDAVSAPRPVSGTRIARGNRHAGVARFAADGRELLLLIVEPGADEPAPPRPPAREPEAAPADFDETPIETMFPEIAEDSAAEAEEEQEPEPVGLPPVTVRFTWEIDGAGRFIAVSDELPETVGAANGAVAGRTWAEVSAHLGLDPDGVVTRALDTGRSFTATVYWPDEGCGDSVAVDLAGQAVRGAQAAHRGFGLIRTDDRKPDLRADKVGLPAHPAPEPEAAPAPEPPAPEDAEPPPARDDLDDAARKSVEEGTGKPRLRAVTRKAAEEPSNVVHLTTPQTERLSGTEREAFRRIAEALGTPPEDESADREPETATPAPPSPAALPPDFDGRLLDRLPIGIVIFRERRTLFANRTLLDLLGYDSLEAFVAAGGGEAIFPDNGTLSGGLVEAGGRLAASKRDGTRIAVRAWLHAVSFGGATALMLSLSNGQAAEAEDESAAAIARSAARADELAAILDTATDGVIVIDGRGKIESLNRAAEALFGIEADHYRGRYFTDLLADESQKPALDYLDGLAANGVASVLNDGREVIGRVPNGGLIPLFMTMGRISGTEKFCAVLRDITHWKNVEEELTAARRAAEAANQQKSDFLAKISHEIRTPLNAIIGFSEVMMEERFGSIGSSRYRDYLRDIHVSGAHLMSLINDLLDLSKIEAGKVDLTFESIAVNGYIQECVAIMQPQANRERIIIRTSLAADLPNVVADPRSFRQILLNLLSNAIKFTRAGGQVIVSTSLEDSGEVVVRIRDTGIGMSEKDIETALKPFRQVAASADDREHGTGLGLPLTKAMVEANRASFAIESAPNQGTLVKITFPTTRVLAG